MSLLSAAGVDSEGTTVLVVSRFAVTNGDGMSSTRWGRWRVALAGLALLWAVVGSATAAEVSLRLDIGAQPLAEALIAFGAQTGISVVAASELTAGKTCRTVRGQFTRQQALARLLQGTGLVFESSMQGTIVIVRGPSKLRLRGT